MLARALAFTAAVAMGAAPCAAAELNDPGTATDRRTGASAGLYFAIPFGGERSGRAQAGLRLRMTQDSRDSSARVVRSVGRDTLELRLLGERRPTLFVAEVPVTGRENRHNLMGGGPLGIAVIALALVGAYVIYEEINDEEEDTPN
jgi:hypothetical protein